MKYRIIATSRFEKDVKRCKKRNLPMEKLKKVIRLLEETGKLPPEYKPHKLSGQYAGSWECHIMPDWLLIWKQYNDELVLVMTNTGSSSTVLSLTLSTVVTGRTVGSRRFCSVSVVCSH